MNIYESSAPAARLRVFRALTSAELRARADTRAGQLLFLLLVLHSLFSRLFYDELLTRARLYALRSLAPFFFLFFFLIWPCRATADCFTACRSLVSRREGMCLREKESKVHDNYIRGYKILKNFPPDNVWLRPSTVDAINYTRLRMRGEKVRLPRARLFFQLAVRSCD